jgi:hypothetical protein
MPVAQPMHCQPGRTVALPCGHSCLKIASWLPKVSQKVQHVAPLIMSGVTQIPAQCLIVASLEGECSAPTLVCKRVDKRLDLL